MTTSRKTTKRTTATKTDTDLAAQLEHAKAWLAASTENGDPDVHLAQQRVDELTARIADADA